MLEDGLNVSLIDAIDAALTILEKGGISFDRAAVRAEVIDFFITRTRVMLRDGGCEADTIEAVLATGIEEPMVIAARSRALENARTEDKETFDDLATAYARANNLRDAEAGIEVDEAKLIDHGKALSAAVAQAEKSVSQALAEDDYAAALADLAALRAPIDDFLTNVMVMDEDAEVRASNMKLLNRFVSVFANVADFGKMAKSK